jgi:tail fiber protein
MSIATVSYNTSGSVGPYTITFPYLSQADVKVYLDDVLKTLTTDYTFSSATQITLVTAPSAVVIRLTRDTQDSPYVDFTDPAPIVEADLDTSTRQGIYMGQEAKDDAERVDARVTVLNTVVATAVVVAGNVPTPADPGDNNKILKALNGLFSWATAFVASTGITDSTATGRSIVTAADAAAVRTAADAAQQYDPVVLTPSASITIDASLGDYFTLASDQSFTLNAPSNPTNGKRIMLRVKQDAGGGNVITYNGIFRFGSDLTAAVLSTAANKVDYLGFVYDSTDAKWDIVAFVKGY